MRLNDATKEKLLKLVLVGLFAVAVAGACVAAGVK